MMKNFFKKNSSTILTIVGAAGVIATAVLAVKATPKAMASLEEAELEKDEPLTTIEKIKIAGPAYIPAIATGASTIICIFGANALNKKQQASLISAYAMLEQSYQKYKNKAVELFGEAANRDIHKALASDIHEDEYEYPKDDDEIWCWTNYSMQRFYSTPETLDEGIRTLNRLTESRIPVSVNDFYNMIGAPLIEGGNYVGWNGPVEIETDIIELDDGLECFTIVFLTEPTADFIY